MIVAARTSVDGAPEDGITLFLVPSGIPGLEVSPIRIIGNERQFEVALNNVRVPASSVLGEVNGGWPIAERAIQRAVAGHCLTMLGGANRRAGHDR